MGSAWLVALFLTACASDSPEATRARPERVIVGQTTPEDQALIDAYNQQIRQTEQGIVSNPTASSSSTPSAAASPVSAATDTPATPDRPQAGP